MALTNAADGASNADVREGGGGGGGQVVAASVGGTEVPSTRSLLAQINKIKMKLLSRLFSSYRRYRL